MITVPRIAVFRPEPRQEDALHQVVKKYDYIVRFITQPQEIIELLEDEQDPFDVVVVPLILHDMSHGMRMCLQVKANEILAAIPVLGISFSPEKNALESLYTAGADMVMTSPLDADHFYLQIGALTRQKRSFDELSSHHYEQAGLRRSTLQAFNAVRQGIVVIDRNDSLRFANDAAVLLLGLENETTISSSEQVSARVLRQFLSLRTPSTSQAADSVRTHNLKLTRVDEQSFGAAVTNTPLTSREGIIVGHAFSITDQSELQHLAHMMTIAERTRAVSLLLSWTTMKLRGSSSLGVPGDPLQHIETMVEQEAVSSDVEATFGALLEAIDPLLGSDATIKMSVPSGYRVQVREPDLMLLIGHLVLHTVNHAGVGGETRVEIEESGGEDYVHIRISGRSRRVTPVVGDDHLTKLVRGEFEAVLSTAPGEVSETPYSIRAAVKIAKRYGIAMQYKEPHDTEKVFRVSLPCDPSGCGVK